ncbi:hypothetical protein BYT27DRAFT_7184477 [Phlegmacium glaucopus]|nr:hypothetical protein BYT27DRAFT_7184477 [Phlegmacium glaucopus]
MDYFVDRDMLATTFTSASSSLEDMFNQSDDLDDSYESTDLPRVNMVQGNIVLARTRITQPHLPELTCRFLFEELNPNIPLLRC